jgi:hypothetical protein
MVRFGRWQEIIDAPLCFHDADQERQLFHDSLRCTPSQRKVFNYSSHSKLAVGEKMLDGKLEYHKGDHELAYAHLGEAIDRDDNLEYIEPWAWMHSPRHALSALLAEQGHYREAEKVCRDDLV